MQFAKGSWRQLASRLTVASPRRRRAGGFEIGCELRRQDAAANGSGGRRDVVRDADETCDWRRRVEHGVAGARIAVFGFADRSGVDEQHTVDELGIRLVRV